MVSQPVEAGFLEARAGKVRLLTREELAKGGRQGGMSVPTIVPTHISSTEDRWDPQKDKRPTAWEACQHLIYNLETGGEQAAVVLLAKLGSLSETGRDLSYRLYTVCERKGWAQDALGYNMLVIAWPRLKELARGKVQPEQGRLL
jgi:putative DNA methylase